MVYLSSVLSLGFQIAGFIFQYFWSEMYVRFSVCFILFVVGQGLGQVYISIQMICFSLTQLACSQPNWLILIYANIFFFPNNVELEQNHLCVNAVF